MTAPRTPPPAGLLQALTACLLLLLLGSDGAHGHSFFDPYCCSGEDCKPYPKAEVQPVPGGWNVTPEPGAQPIFFKQEAYRASEDGEIYLCIYQGQARCIYLAPRS